MFFALTNAKDDLPIGHLDAQCIAGHFPFPFVVDQCLCLFIFDLACFHFRVIFHPDFSLCNYQNFSANEATEVITAAAAAAVNQWSAPTVAE